MYITQIRKGSGAIVLTITKPQSLNALSKDLLEELAHVFVQLRDEKSINGIILTGDGDKAFVAGADIKELAQLSEKEAFNLIQNVQSLFNQIENFPKPVIAVVNGFALGGGCELAMSCHMRIATENAKFGQPEVNLGIIPGYGGTQRLTQLVGRGKALELLMTGDLIDAREAKEVGLVNHVVATKEEGLEKAEKIITKISGKGPIAISYIVQSVNAGFEFQEKGYEMEKKLFVACTTTEDFKEGTTAFIEKRKPNFKGN